STSNLFAVVVGVTTRIIKTRFHWDNIGKPFCPNIYRGPSTRADLARYRWVDDLYICAGINRLASARPGRGLRKGIGTWEHPEWPASNPGTQSHKPDRDAYPSQSRPSI